MIEKDVGRWFGGSNSLSVGSESDGWARSRAGGRKVRRCWATGRVHRLS